MTRDNMLTSTPGIVLKKRAYGEADEVLSVLLKSVGMVTFFAAGSRKSKKRFNGCLDHFNHLIFHYKPSRKGLWRLQSIDEFSDLIVGHEWEEPVNFAFASYLAELIVEFSREGDGDHGLYDLWLELKAECSHTRLTHTKVLPYLMRFFEAVGYAPQFHSDLVRKEQMSERRLFNKLILFSENIMQKSSKAAPFLIQVMR